MLVGQYALLPENKSGFWVEKKFRLDDTDFAYIVFHQGMAEFSNSISEAKQKLHERSEKFLRDRQAKRAIASIQRIASIRPIVIGSAYHEYRG